MKLRVDRQEFTEAIAWATRVAGSRAALPALTGVLLEAADGRLVCRATDLEVSAEIGVPATVEKPGRTLLAARFLAQLVARSHWLALGAHSRPPQRCRRRRLGVGHHRQGCRRPYYGPGRFSFVQNQAPG